MRAKPDLRKKALKFLSDVGVGRKVEEWLVNNGYDVKTMRVINPKETDSEILKLAETEDRMIITMDKDFGELVHNSGKAHAGVMILRLEDANGDRKAEVISHIMTKYSDEIQNRFCVFQNGRLRVR